MFLVVVTSLIAWFAIRRWGVKYALVAFVFVGIGTSYVIVNNVWTAGVYSHDVAPPLDTEYSITYYKSTALFPFVIQKQHNWTAKTFVHQVRLLNHDGQLIIESGGDDQSEIMHLSLIGISLLFCLFGIQLSVVLIIFAEVARWLLKK